MKSMKVIIVGAGSLLTADLLQHLSDTESAPFLIESSQTLQPEDRPIITDKFILSKTILPEEMKSGKERRRERRRKYKSRK